jgi:hypothetical protein
LATKAAAQILGQMPSPRQSVRFYKPGQMRWFVLNGSTNQHLYTAHFTKLVYVHRLGIMLHDKDGEFAYICPWAECADAIDTPEDVSMQQHQIQTKTLADPERASDFEDFIKNG